MAVNVLRDSQIREETRRFWYSGMYRDSSTRTPFWSLGPKQSFVCNLCGNLQALHWFCSSFCCTEYVHLLTEGYPQAVLTLPHPTSVSCQRGFCENFPTYIKYFQTAISIKQRDLATVKASSVTVREDASGSLDPGHRVPGVHTSYRLCPRAFLNCSQHLGMSTIRTIFGGWIVVTQHPLAELRCRGALTLAVCYGRPHFRSWPGNYWPVFSVTFLMMHLTLCHELFL